MLQFGYFFQPCSRTGIAWHTPVTSRTDGDTSYLWTIGQTRTFELLIEEPAEKGLQPFFDGFSIVYSVKYGLCQKVYFRRAEAESQKIVQEKVVEFIRTYQIFRFLFDFSILICRYQFRTDRSVYNVQQGYFRFPVNFIFSYPLYKMLYQCLGYAYKY